MDKFVFGVDLDGVVADFYGGMRPIAAEWLGVDIDSLPVDVTYGLQEWGLDDAPGGYGALHKFAVTQRGLFKELSPIPGAPSALRELSDADIRIRIVTHRLFIKYFHQQAVQQTIEWLDFHDIPYSDLCFMSEKSAVGADLYIDDAPAYIDDLRAAGFSTIVFSNSTNTGMAAPRASTWDEVIPQVLAAEAEWQERKSAPEAG
ncbi:MAG: 5'-nucleotidase [Actinomycetota bacterium]|nr:5'-nucleotidase [Actinomycetota bacterium]